MGARIYSWCFSPSSSLAGVSLLWVPGDVSGLYFDGCRTSKRNNFFSLPASLLHSLSFVISLRSLHHSLKTNHSDPIGIHSSLFSLRLCSSFLTLWMSCTPACLSHTRVNYNDCVTPISSSGSSSCTRAVYRLQCTAVAAAVGRARDEMTRL